MEQKQNKNNVTQRKTRNMKRFKQNAKQLGDICKSSNKNQTGATQEVNSDHFMSFCARTPTW